jgi:chaperonin cofactor prefoldin
MSVNFQQLAPIFAVCMGTGSMLINYGSYSQSLKDLHFKVEAQEKKVNTIDIMANEISHLQGTLDELKINIKNEFADLKHDLKDIKHRMK